MPFVLIRRVVDVIDDASRFEFGCTKCPGDRMEVGVAEIECEGDLLLVGHCALSGEEEDEVFLDGLLDCIDVVGRG